LLLLLLLLNIVIIIIVIMQIAEHVLGQHIYRAPGEDGHSIITDAQER